MSRERTNPVKLFFLRGACSLATHIALVWAGGDYELHRIGNDEQDRTLLRTINPKGGVPTLVLESGAMLTESLAILLYLADRFPQAHLGAGDDIVARARLNEALADLVSEIHPAFGPMYVPERFVTVAAYEEDAGAAALIRIDRQFERLESTMRDGREWMVLGRRTVADAYLFVMTRWKDQTKRPLSNYPFLCAYRERLAEDPGVLRAIAEEDKNHEMRWTDASSTSA